MISICCDGTNKVGRILYLGEGLDGALEIANFVGILACLLKSSGFLYVSFLFGRYSAYYTRT